MLHRYFLTFWLAFTFSSAQLGLLAHDISHLHHPLKHSLQGHTFVSDAQSGHHQRENTKNSSVSSAPSEPILAGSTKPVPQTAEPHVCENCVGFAGINISALQTPFVLALHQDISLPLYLSQLFNHHSVLRHQAARAPPKHLI